MKAFMIRSARAMVALFAAIHLSGCGVKPEPDQTKAVGEAATDAESRPIPGERLQARTEVASVEAGAQPGATPEPAPEPMLPESAYRRDVGKTLKPQLISFPDAKRLLYQASSVGVRRGTDFNYFGVAHANWRGLTTDGTNIWIYCAFSLTANSYLFSNQGGPGNRLLPGQSSNRDHLLGLYTLNPSGGAGKFEILPVVPAPPFGAVDHGLVQLARMKNDLFYVNGDQIIRRHLPSGQQQSVAIAGANVSLHSIDEQTLIAASPDAILRVYAEPMRVEVLASTKRRPAVHELDSATGFRATVWSSGKGGIRVVTQSQDVYELDSQGMNARKLVSVFGAENYVLASSEGAFFQSGQPTGPTAVFRMLHDAPAPILAFTAGNPLLGHPPVNLTAGGEMRPKWQTPEGFLPSVGNLAVLPGGVAVFSFTGLAYFDEHNAGSAVFPLQIQPLPPAATRQPNGISLDKWMTLNDALVYLKTGRPFLWRLPFAEFLSDAAAAAAGTPKVARRQASASGPPVAVVTKLPTFDPKQQMAAMIAAIEKNADRIDSNQNLKVDDSEFRNVDMDNDGQISPFERMKLREVYGALSMRAIARADQNGDGLLQQDELERAARSFAKLPPLEQAKAFDYGELRDADRNRDGVLDVGEIADWQTTRFMDKHTVVPKGR